MTREFKFNFKDIAVILLVTLGLTISVAASIITMIYGWGLHPQNWWVIIGIGLGVNSFAQIIIEVAKKLGENK